MAASFTVEASLPIAVAAMASTNHKFATKHGKIGLAMLIGVVILFISGTVRQMGISNQGTKYLGSNYGRPHQINKYLHRWLGRAMVVLGLFNCCMGLMAITGKKGGYQSKWLFPVQGLADNGSDSLNLALPGFEVVTHYIGPIALFLYIILFVTAEIHLQLGRRQLNNAITKKLTLPSFSLEQFNDGVMQGEKWVIVNDAVVDVADYMRVHPGGSKVLKDSSALCLLLLRCNSDKAWMAIQAHIIAHQTALCNSDSRRQRWWQQQQPEAQGHGRRAAVPEVYPEDDSVRVMPLNVGFYHKFRVVSHGSVIQRSYTPVVQHTMPSGRLGFEYYIRLYESGQMSVALAHLKVGDTVRIQGPFEIKEIRNCPPHVYMIAGGTGVTPMLQLVRCHINRLNAMDDEANGSFTEPTNASLLPPYRNQGSAQSLEMGRTRVENEELVDSTNRSSASTLGSMQYSGSTSQTGLGAGSGGGVSSSGMSDRFQSFFSRAAAPPEEDDARKAARQAMNARATTAMEQASADD
ncbi:hypothetical protein JKP88DRAFT_246308 [Tribonema minus]|uniref:Flavoprotein pyridine nucleotide cytochrome reductase-like FAD-binding domain-containing protein n=1 Tax=Tribonema minus TaxID=303371 RepID=A0A836CEM2_9STRA|nr:hypothetical protein JKP88DRAFT_246308 [Tribonema minus]